MTVLAFLRYLGIPILFYILICTVKSLKKNREFGWRILMLISQKKLSKLRLEGFICFNSTFLKTTGRYF